MPQTRPLAVARWLFVVAGLIIGLVVVGGITRLTESGVSITEWKPIAGAIPPLTEADWQAEFAKYQQTPQFIRVNGPAGMTLATYKSIFFWEWLHRLWARSIGVAFALPLAWFWARGQIPQGYKGRLLALLALGGLQGVIGWWMVKSGISQDVKVSHIRLAIHLMTAMITLAGVVWTALDLRAGMKSRLTGLGLLGLWVVAGQMKLGALVAGLRAGLVASDWPLMNGDFFPRGVDSAQGWWHALCYDPFLLQFMHRWWAWLVVAVLVVMARRLRPLCRPASVAIHTAFGVQVLLGIGLLMMHVPIWMAALHQLVGVLVLVSTVWGAHELGRKR